MRTLQCPKCQLRFRTRGEALWHLRQDHRRTTGQDLATRLHRQPRRRQLRASATR
jgi:uncharacterized C2H2 Zn-finger protein